jgi:NitT/TauT family transport system substrate-binding protein
VDATLRHHGASEALFTALVSGQEDFVVAGADEMMQARSQGMDLVAIAPYYRQYPVVLIVKGGSDIKTAADLKGRSIGIPGRYGESWFGLKVLLNSAGYREDDVTIAEIGYTAQAALTSDKVDSIIGFSNNDVVTFNNGGVPVRTIPLTADGAPPLVSICLITTKKYLDAHGDLATKVADASVAGQAAVVKDPAQALAISADYVTTLKSDEAARTAAGKTLEATLPLWKGPSGTVDAQLDAAQFSAMATFMEQQGLVETDVNPATAMSNAYHS